MLFRETVAVYSLLAKQTNTHARKQQKNEGKQMKTQMENRGKHKWKRAESDNVKKRQKKAAKQNPLSI
jgi:hypothetical protein